MDPTIPTLSGLQPLPIPLRAFHGESPQSYLRRLAAHNHCTIRDLNIHLRRHGVTAPSWQDPTRLDALRRLGGLDEHSFTTPVIWYGNLVAERPLCLRCCDGEAATGRVSHIGYICHGWMPDAKNLLTPIDRHPDGRSQLDALRLDTAVTDQPRLRQAEQQFRSNLAARGILHDSYVMRLSLGLVLHHSPKPFAATQPRLLDRIYPRLIATASQLQLTRSDIIGALADPDTTYHARALAIALIIRIASTNPPHPAKPRLQGHPCTSNRLWMLAGRLQAIVRHARYTDQQPVDPESDLLRHHPW